MLTDTRAGYGAIAILLHWITAVALAYLWFTAPDDQGGRITVDSSSHIAAGGGLAALFLARILWRLGSANPAPLSASTGLNTVASIVKMLLLLDILLIVGTGMLGVWFAGKPVSLFGLATLPNIVGTNASLAGPMRGLHSLSTNLILPALVGLHVLGALKHLVIDRDGTFGRMLWPRSNEAA